MKHRLRPQRSVSLLQGIMRTAMINRNRVMVTCTPVTVVSRSSLMSLIITFMFEPAKLQMNWARASGASIRSGRSAGWLNARGAQPAAGSGSVSAVQMARAARISVRWLKACMAMPSLRHASRHARQCACQSAGVSASPPGAAEMQMK